MASAIPFQYRLLESFKFEGDDDDEYEYEYEICLKIFSRIIEKCLTRKASLKN